MTYKYNLLNTVGNKIFGNWNMNILHVSANYYPEIGGHAASVPYLVRELIKKGHETSVLTLGVSGFPRFDVLDGIPVYRSKRIPGYYYIAPFAVLKSLAMGLEARRIVEKDNIEIIHSHSINVNAIAGIIGTKFKDVKKVTKFPGDLAWELLSLIRYKDEDPETFLGKNNLPIRSLEFFQRKICEQYDLVLAPSRYMKMSLMKYSSVEESKIEVVYNGMVNYEYPKDKIETLRSRLLGKNRVLLISACRMVPWKGIEYLIDALRLMQNDIKLILIGDGPMRDKLQKKAEGLNIEFLGRIPHEEVQAYIRASDLYILPSIYEPSSHALLDCLVTQTPIIATNVGGTPEIISNGKTGLLIKDRDSVEIAGAIQVLLSDEELYRKIKENQKEECEKYLWENMIDRYIGVYKRVLERN